MTTKTASALLSTRQTARILGVHESSVKRWCNDGDLSCELTTGGHRRIPVDDLVDFAGRQGLRSSLTDCGSIAARAWMGLTESIKQDDYSTLVRLIKEDLDRNDSVSPFRVARLMGEEGIPLAAILDHVVGKILADIGSSWRLGETDIGEEHRLTQLLQDFMNRLRWFMPSNGRADSVEKPTAVVGSLAGSRHEMGALMVRLLLEDIGWKVVYLGSDVPSHEFALQQAMTRAKLVAGSVVPPHSVPDARRLVDNLSRSYDDASPYHLALGGSGVKDSGGEDLNGSPFASLGLFSSMTEFDAWVRQLPETSP